MALQLAHPPLSIAVTASNASRGKREEFVFKSPMKCRSYSWSAFPCCLYVCKPRVASAHAVRDEPRPEHAHGACCRGATLRGVLLLLYRCGSLVEIFAQHDAALIIARRLVLNAEWPLLSWLPRAMGALGWVKEAHLAAHVNVISSAFSQKPTTSRGEGAVGVEGVHKTALEGPRVESKR